MSRLKPKRIAYEIAWKILDFCRSPQRLTHIILSCNLNTVSAKRYIDLVISKNMLVLDGENYKTTAEGLRYIKLIEEVYLELFM